MKYEMGIKFICIDNKNIEDKVTIGNIYDGYVYNNVFINIISDLNFITSFLYIFLISLHNTLPVCVNAYNCGNISFNSLLKLEIPIFDLFYAINFLYLKILALAILLQ